MYEKVEQIKKKILEHKLESIFFGISLVLFLFSLVLFTQIKIGVASQNTIIIQKNKPMSTKTMVDIGGAVKKPGVYAIVSGQRIYELVDKAGGLTDNADLSYFDKNINRAQKLNDQLKIYIPFKNLDNFSQPSYTNPSALVSLNSSNISDLESLPGVGAVTAKKIIDGRPYGNLTDLLNKKIVKSNVFEDIEKLITL